MPGPNANPPWTREEDVLAYDLLKRVGAVGQGHQEVIELSEMLRSLNLPGAALSDTVSFRNPAGVAMKLQNLEFLDSDRSHGLPSGSKMDEQVVEEFRGNTEGLRAVADSIRVRMPSVRAAWVIRARDGDTYLASDCETVGVIAVGYKTLTDLSGKSRDELRVALERALPDKSEATRANLLYQIDAFVNVVKPGDIVLTPTTKEEGEVLVGEVSGPYRYADQAVVGDWHHVHSVTWKGSLLRSELPPQTTAPLSTPRTIARIPDAASLVTILDQAAKPASPLHLILKWRLEEEPRTIELHRDVVREQGSVWWGKLGDPNSSHAAMSERVLKRLRDQLADGFATHVYLYRPGEVWRTDLHDITKERADTDEALIPRYYGSNTHNLWVRLSGFERLEPSWVLTHLQPAGPRGAESPMETFLRSRSSVLYVYERQDVVSAPLPPAGPGRRGLTVELVQQFATARGLQVDESVYAAIIAAVHSGKHVILTGPPGTAKTTLAQAIADAATEAGISGGTLMTTATADWTTYETPWSGQARRAVPSSTMNTADLC
jgi:hypothetical protein